MAGVKFCRRCRKKKSACNCGRPEIMTPEVIRKLEEVFAIGGSDLEACLYADIGKTTLYSFQKEHPEFLARKEKLKERPILLARQEVIKGIVGNPELALKFLEKRKKDEFWNAVAISGDALNPIRYEIIDATRNNDNKKNRSNKRISQKPESED